MRLRQLRVACLLAASAAAGGHVPLSAHAQQPEPRARFDTKAELVLVDVTVVDRNSRPVMGLAPGDFDLQVNGQARPIQSVQFVSTVPADAAPPSPREGLFTSNEGATTGRLLLFVVDESNMRAGSSRAVLRAATTLMDRLAPGDLVGLARLPTGVGGVEFTTDRSRLMAALQRATGTLGSHAGPTKVRLSEAWALENNDMLLWQQAIDRECAGEEGGGREACATVVETDARGLLIETTARTQATVQSLEGLLSRLVPLKTPVNIVMISEGLFVARDRQNMQEIAKRAADARATLHIIRPSQAYFDIDDRASPGVSRFYDDSLMSEGLDQLAGQTRGTMSTVSGSAEGAFDRLGRELSGYYLLGFEPSDADRTGKERRIKVQVKRRDIIVRARPTFIIRDAAVQETPVEASSPVEQVRQLVSGPIPTRGLPMRVASYAATTAGTSQVRVVISAEIGEPATEAAEWSVGVVVLDKNGKAVVNNAGPVTLPPASDREASPRLLLTSVVLDPGEYTIRIAAVDAEGHGGSVYHTFDARFRPAGKLNVSDLVLASERPSADDTPRPRPSGVIDNESVTALLEMTGDAALLGRARVSVQVAEAENGPALVSVDARQASRGDGLRAFVARLKLGVLPPGEYVARAVVTAPGQSETKIVRPFLLARVASAASTAAARVDPDTPLDPDAPPPPPPPIKILAPVPRFVPDTVLLPQVLTPFLDGLADLHPPSSAVAAILDQARNGAFTAPAATGSTPDDEIALSFVRGLGAFQKGDIAQASAWFQVTLKGASDFLGAAFYLGACHAVSGRDREAIGAWQMALLSENPGAVYPPLVDALLRVGDGRQAVEFIEEAPTAWPSDDQRARREATAEAMLGDYPSAWPKLKALLDAQPDDSSLLFLTIQVLYRLHLDGKGLDPPTRARFADYAARYLKTDGANKALVETYRKYVMK